MQHCWTKTLLAILVTLIVNVSGYFDCQFDAVKPKNIIQANVQYMKSTKKFKRDTANIEHLFQPIRLRTHFFNFTDITRVEQVRLKGVIHDIVLLAEQLFSVVPVQGALLLKRTGCRKFWDSGVNAGKCAIVRERYSGETCGDPFKIPNDHLEGFSVWDAINLNPKTTFFSPGQGLMDTDYIVYVQSAYTRACLQGGLNIIAYASYCQTDQHGRPIAGYINICPQLLKHHTFQFDKVFKAALHELFHALGFSADLFGKFGRCRLDNGGSKVTCSRYSSAFSWLDGAYRLTTPMVSQLASEHFNCSVQDGVFGAILESGNGVLGSHWDAAFMQGSIMTPSVLLPHLVVIDNITLAAFEDSGWYRVNYDFADNFVWGRGGGCNFGLNPSCEQANDSFFCHNSTKGCHHGHLDKGECSTTPFLHQCRIIRATMPSTCQVAPDDSSIDESFSASSRCFMSNITQLNSVDNQNTSSHLLESRCYEHRCTEAGQLYIKLFNSSWHACPYGKFIRVAFFEGVIKCPQAGILCVSNHKWRTVAPPFIRNTTNFTHVNCVERTDVDNATLLHVTLLFSNLTVNLVTEKDDLMFTEAVTSRLTKLLSICRQTLTSAVLSRQNNSVYVTVINNASHLQNYVEILTASVNSDNFTVIVKKSGFTAISMWYRFQLTSSNPATSTVDTTQFVVLTSAAYSHKVVGVSFVIVCAIILLVVVHIDKCQCLQYSQCCENFAY